MTDSGYKLNPAFTRFFSTKSVNADVVSSNFKDQFYNVRYYLMGVDLTIIWTINNGVTCDLLRENAN